MIKPKPSSLLIEKIKLKHINEGWLDWVNDIENTKTLNSKQSKYTKKQLINYLKKVKQNKEIMLAVSIKKNSEYIGNIKLNYIDHVHKNCGYGLMIGNKKYRGQFYGVLMLYKICEYAFEKLKMNKVFTPVFTDNYGSILTHLRFGLRISGHFKNHFRKNHKFKDVFYFELTKDEFKKIKFKYK